MYTRDKEQTIIKYKLKNVSNRFCARLLHAIVVNLAIRGLFVCYSRSNSVLVVLFFIFCLSFIFQYFMCPYFFRSFFFCSLSLSLSSRLLLVVQLVSPVGCSVVCQVCNFFSIIFLSHRMFCVVCQVPSNDIYVTENIRRFTFFFQGVGEKNMERFSIEMFATLTEKFKWIVCQKLSAQCSLVCLKFKAIHVMNTFIRKCI